jgi:hypothetical protein
MGWHGSNGMVAMVGRSLALAVLAAALLTAGGAHADPHIPVLIDDFEGKDFAATSGLYYKNNFEQSAGSVRFVSTDARDGKGALALTIRPLCSVTDGDCSERAEVWEKQDVLAGYGETVWYAFSMKLVDPIPQDDHRYLMAQWKREITPAAAKSYSPFLALRLDKGKITVTVETDEVTVAPLGTPERPHRCKEGETLVANRPHDAQTRALAAWQADMDVTEWRYQNGCTTDIKVEHYGNDLPAAETGWIDFVFAVRTGPKGGGRIGIAANGKPVALVTGRIGHEGVGLGDKMYFKFGPYRAGQDAVWTVLYDRFRRGPRCEDVTEGALCNLW